MQPLQKGPLPGFGNITISFIFPFLSFFGIKHSWFGCITLTGFNKIPLFLSLNLIKSIITPDSFWRSRQAGQVI